MTSKLYYYYQMMQL